MRLLAKPMPPLKPRNPLAIAAKQRAAGPHQKSPSAQRQTQKILLDKKLGDLKKETPED